MLLHWYSPPVVFTVAVLAAVAAATTVLTLRRLWDAAAAWFADPRRPKPPLGWAPWEKPKAGRVVHYRVARWRWHGARAARWAFVKLGAKKSW